MQRLTENEKFKQQDFEKNWVEEFLVPCDCLHLQNQRACWTTKSIIIHKIKNWSDLWKLWTKYRWQLKAAQSIIKIPQWSNFTSLVYKCVIFRDVSIMAVSLFPFRNPPNSFIRTKKHFELDEEMHSWGNRNTRKKILHTQNPSHSKNGHITSRKPQKTQNCCNKKTTRPCLRPQLTPPFDSTPPAGRSAGCSAPGPSSGSPASLWRNSSGQGGSLPPACCTATPLKTRAAKSRVQLENLGGGRGSPTATPQNNKPPQIRLGFLCPKFDGKIRTLFWRDFQICLVLWNGMSLSPKGKMRGTGNQSLKKPQGGGDVGPRHLF